MHRILRTTLIATAAASALLLSSCSSGSGVQTYVDGWTNSTAVTGATEESLVSTMDEAYDFGSRVAAGLPVAGERFGYKFGCGANVCPFAEHIPLVGTLWQGMVQPAGSTVDTSEYVRGFVEGELAFKLPGDITEPVTAQQLQAMDIQVAPAVELPDFPFGEGPLSDTPILDVIADNAIARGVVIGDYVPASSVDVNSVMLTGTRDGAPVLSGGTPDVTLGSHWEALALAIKLLLEHGHDVKAGDSIITGTMGEPTPFEDGTYELTYGPLGSLTFTGASGSTGS
jgi:2-keto-4-pentenoate hydratase